MKNCLCQLLISVMLLGPAPTLAGAQQHTPPPSVQQTGPASQPTNGNSRQTSDTNYGRVTVGKPKIWSFDRIHSTLDGLLRDIDAVQLASLAALDANESNQAMLDFLSSSLNVKADFNQRAATLNALEVEKVSAVRPVELQRLQVHNERMRQAERRRVDVERQLADARDRLSKLDPDSPNFARDKGIEEEKIKALTEERTELATILSQSAPAVTDIDKTRLEAAEGIQPTALPTPLINASDLKEALLGKFNSKDPGLPATKKLDNFVTLLHERLSRQLSISFDDNAREKELFLVQFDVGIYPQKDAANHLLRVEFDVAEENGSRPPLAYDLYPGLSAYNMTEYWGKSRGTGIAGSAAFLFGFGLGAEYKRQRDQVRSAMTQNVYISGFGAGTSTFGWYFGPSPFEKLISPGNRTAYAVIALDKNSKTEGLSFTPRVKWVHRTKADDRPNETLGTLTVSTPDPQLIITRLAYQTKYSPGEPKHDAANEGQKRAEEFGTVQITFAETIDPNLVITVNGAVLKRLRDVRGRATAQKSATTNGNNDGPKTAVFGLLETDAENESHWFALGARSISLKLAKSLVGSEAFPRIRLLSAGNSSVNGGMELLSLLQRRALPVRAAKSGPAFNWEILINDWTFRNSSVVNEPPPASAFVPMFSTVDYVEDVNAWVEGKTIKVARENASPCGAPPCQAPLDENTQVVLIKNQSNSNPDHIPLRCFGYGELICNKPAVADPAAKDWIAVERPAKNELRGIADKKPLRDAPPSRLPRLAGGYVVSPMATAMGEVRGWHLHLPAKHLNAAQDELQGFAVLSPAITPSPSWTKSTTQLVFGDAANYRIAENGIEFWIPSASLAAIIQSRLSLHRDAEFKFHLPEMASKLLPHVSDITKDAGSIAIKGTNLGLVERIVFRGCGGQCNRISFGVSNGLISFPHPRRVTGVFPIALQLRNGVVVEAAKPNGETWSIIFQPDTNPAMTLASRKHRKEKPPLSGPAKKDAAETDERTGAQLFLLSPPPPSSAPAKPSDLEQRARSKQTTVQ